MALLPAMDLFLQANAAREGVTTTASGLQYEVLTAGSGASPGPRSEVHRSDPLSRHSGGWHGV